MTEKKMRRVLLEAEQGRLQEIIDCLAKLCPVCEVSRRETPRFASEACYLTYMKPTACPLAVQKRCRSFLAIRRVTMGRIARLLEQVKDDLLRLESEEE